jgi:hypothetical protein
LWHHCATLHVAAQGRLGGKEAAEFESLILIFQVLRPFPVCAESFLSKWTAASVMASNFLKGGM